MTFHVDEDEYDEPHPVIYIHTEQVFGIILSYGAYTSLVRYEKMGMVYEVVIENDEFTETYE